MFCPILFSHPPAGGGKTSLKNMTRQITDTYPLSPMQEGMLFNSLFSPGTGIEIQQIACDLQEEVRPGALREAWEAVVARHALLRTSFSWDGEPLQHVHGSVEIPWAVEQISCAGPEEERECLEEFLRRDRDTGMDLAAPPLMRLTLLELGPGHACLVWTFHHAVLDGRSFPIILNEAFSTYDALVTGGEVRLPPVVPFRDFIVWLRSRDFSASREFWRNMLSGFARPTPVPCDLGRGGEGGAGGRHSEGQVVFSGELSASIRTFAAAQGVTLNTLIQGCWSILLSRYTGEEDIVFGAIRACRHATVPGADSMVGIFINMLPVRVTVRRDARLLPFLQELRTRQTEVRPHEHLSLAEVQALSPIPRGTPLFNSILVFDNSSLNARLRGNGGRWLRRTFTIRSQTGYPLTLAMYGDDEIVLKIEYDRRRYDLRTIERILMHARTMLEGMTKDPMCRLGDLPWLTEAERSGLLAMSTPPRAPIPGACLHSLFEEQVRRNPSGIALSMDGSRMTYDELNRKANRLAHRLIGLGVGADRGVGICMDRSPAMIAGILGVLKAGGAYVPLDPAYPAEHLAYVIEDARIALVVTDTGAAAVLPENITCLKIDDPAAEGFPEGNPGLMQSDRSLAYIIYTSGTTGRPKGVMVEHRSVLNYVMTIGSRLRVSPDDVVLQFSSISFDTSAEEIYGSLLHGATLALRSAGMIDTFSGFLTKCGELGVTLLDLPTAYWHQLAGAMVAEGLSLPTCTRMVLIGGEEASVGRLAQWRKCVAPSVRLINTYGPTETTIVATMHEVPPGAGEEEGTRGVPIGRPIANCSAYILDAEKRLVPVGVPGELAIGGEGLARGYLGRPDLDDGRFISDPFDATGGGRLYRTGDLARWLPEGVIEFLGRSDLQVKIRGFRIEPGEIEAVLAQHAAVRDVAVIAREDHPGERKLVAYCIFRGDGEDEAAELRTYLKRRLPAHMIPSAFVAVEAFPTTAGGKMDRRGFPPPGGDGIRSPERRDIPMSPTEKKLAGMFGETLGLPSVGIEDNFFDLGGHSLLAMQLISRIRHAWNISVSLADLFEVPSVRGLASLIEGKLVEEIEKMSDEEVAGLRK